MNFQYFVTLTFLYMYIKFYLCKYKHLKSAMRAVQTLSNVLHISSILFKVSFWNINTKLSNYIFAHLLSIIPLF